MSLYLKYRPQDFGSVVGQDHVTGTLQHALEHDSLTHAYLFSGSRGTGKTSLARIIAKALNCTALKDGNEPCNACAICLNIAEGRLVDLIEIDAASNRGIDEIRDLREKIVFAPTQAKRKVYIIDEVHMLTKEAFNALLKTLEEPPSHAYFILATTEIHKIPETIVSRCQQFHFKRITQDAMVRRLEFIAAQESVTAEREALELIARIANGGLRDAIGLFEQMIVGGAVSYKEVARHLGLSGPILIESFFQALMAREAGAALQIISDVNAQGNNIQQFVGEFIATLREQMLLSLQEGRETQAVLKLLDLFLQAKNQIPQCLIPQLPVEMAIARACDFEISAPAPVKKETAPALAEEESPVLHPAAGESPEMDLEKIRTNWPRVAEHIETPFIRLSLQDSEPVSYEKGQLVLAFKSMTYKDKVAQPANQAAVMDALEHVFKSKITLKFEVKKANLAPMSGGDDAPAGDPTVMEMAKEVFGL